ncbi:MAG: DUF2490 domain-containing protein [Prolixibacteraceae bacterium]|nr:DUF2490 domain-containing protein [Prolixibacteraceae bacterium]
MKIYYIYWLLALFIFPFQLMAQNSKVVSDFRSRTSLKVEKGLTKNLNTFVEFELGLEQNITEIGKIHGEAGLEYRIFNDLEVEAKYRITKNRKNYSTNYKLTHTYALSAEYSKRFDLLKGYIRLQFKSIDDEAMSATSFDELRNIVKPRLKFKYDIWGTRLSPYLMSELYLLANNITFTLYKIKNIAGVEYTFFNDNELKFYYRNDRELNAYLPYMYHTLGMTYSIKF